MSEGVVDFLEPINVADHDRKRSLHTTATGHFLSQMNEQRARVGQAGQEIGGGGTLGLLILQRVLHGKSNFGSHRQQNSQIVRRESILVRVVHCQHAHYAVQAFQRNRQRRRQGRKFFRIRAVSRFHLWISVDDRFAILRHPSAQPFAHANFQRRQDAEILSTYKFRQQPAITVYENGDRIVVNQLAQAHRQHGKRFAKAERIAEVLTQLEHRLRLLPSRRDRGKKVSLGLSVIRQLLEARGWSQTAFHPQTFRKSRWDETRLVGLRNPFEV